VLVREDFEGVKCGEGRKSRYLLGVFTVLVATWCRYLSPLHRKHPPQNPHSKHTESCTKFKYLENSYRNFSTNSTAESVHKHTESIRNSRTILRIAVYCYARQSMLCTLCTLEELQYILLHFTYTKDCFSTFILLLCHGVDMEASWGLDGVVVRLSLGHLDKD
jgi:hypothetical protein